MTVNKFNKIVQDLLEHCQVTLGAKAEEYATGDRLHNFKIAGELQDCTPEKALLGMMTKHIVSIYDMVNSNKHYLPEKWDEKIGDAINYLILLKAMTIESHDIKRQKISERPYEKMFDEQGRLTYHCHSPAVGEKDFCYWNSVGEKFNCVQCTYATKPLSAE